MTLNDLDSVTLYLYFDQFCSQNSSLNGVNTYIKHQFSTPFICATSCMIQTVTVYDEALCNTHGRIGNAVGLRLSKHGLSKQGRPRRRSDYVARSIRQRGDLASWKPSSILVRTARLITTSACRLTFTKNEPIAKERLWAS